MSYNAFPYSFADWLQLGGVYYEVREEPASWGQEQSAVSFPAEEVVAMAQPAPKEAVLTTQPFQQFSDLDSYNSHLLSWKKIGICNTSTNTVLGSGVSSPALMLVAEAPDDVEDRSGIAFSGAGNQIILQALQAAGFDHTHIYMTYLSKWRPPGGQRALGKHETIHLVPMLLEEMRLVRPKAVLVLGESVGKLILGESFPGSGGIGKVFSINNQIDKRQIPLMASQKGENLVKTQGMKKNFWFSLLSYTASLRAQAAPNNLE